MVDLNITAIWKSWKNEPPTEICRPMIVFGKDTFTGKYDRQLFTDLIVQLNGTPEFIMKSEGGYEYTGNLTNIRLYLCSDNSLKFNPEEYYMELEYWIYLDELLPNFLKQ